MKRKRYAYRDYKLVHTGWYSGDLRLTVYGKHEAIQSVVINLSSGEQELRELLEHVKLKLENIEEDRKEEEKKKKVNNQPAA
jgi:hypothetical protein